VAEVGPDPVTTLTGAIIAKSNVVLGRVSPWVVVGAREPAGVEQIRYRACARPCSTSRA